MDEQERNRKKRSPADKLFKHVDQLRKRARVLTGEVNFEQEDLGLDTTRRRLNNVLKRHEQLKENLAGLSVNERLRLEFAAARIANTKEISLDDDQWNGGVLATIRERVHIEAELQAAKGKIASRHEQFIREKITYKVGSKVICCLEGGRIGIKYDTFLAGEHREIFYCVLESRSFLEKMHVVEHTIPCFLPLTEAEHKFLSLDPVKFIDYVGQMLQAYVDRREQVRLLKEFYGEKIGELNHTLAYDMIEFMMETFNCKILVTLDYDDIDSELPTQSKVLAWPQSSKAMETGSGYQGNGSPVTAVSPSQLPYAEDALRTLRLPQACAEIGLNLQSTLRHVFPPSGTLSIHSSGAAD